MRGGKRLKTGVIILVSITAALIAAVFFNRITAELLFSSGLLIPRYASTDDKTISDGSVTVIKKGRGIFVKSKGKKIWELPGDVKTQDILLEDIDGDGEKELAVLCWKRGRFGKRRPTWVKEDEKGYSQHIYIYKINEDGITPFWMASDIGPEAVSWSFDDGVLSIEQKDKKITKWKWISWGLERME